MTSFRGGGFSFENWKKHRVEDGMHLVTWANLSVSCDDLTEWPTSLNTSKSL